MRPQRVGLFLSQARTRVPFRFGAVTLANAPVLTARLEAQVAGRNVLGHAADLLVPRWFRKDVERSAEEDQRALAASAEAAAAELLRPGAAASVFEHWWRLWRTRVESQPFEASERLERGFGVALIERALIDAACRAADTSFFAALRSDLLGFEPGVARASLRAWNVAASLPARPLERIAVRHTVGMLDALRERDVAPAARVGDGLPESLEAEIRERGIAHFKIKLRGDLAADRARLSDVWQVLEEHALEAPRLSLDGNEQFASLADVAELLAALAREPAGARMLRHVTHVEQPLARARTFERDPDVERVRGFAPLILDEADVGLEAFERAFELGYRGVSVKNCKGVFRALLQRGTCEQLGDGAFQSGEDLTNLPVLALQQDLATMAALGLDGVERNGHHYFAGLAHLPREEARAALQAHADLYRPWRDGAQLRIERGALEIGSLACSGYGYDVQIDVAGRTELGDWHWSARP